MKGQRLAGHYATGAVGVALVGCGRAGRQHLAALSALDGIEVVGGVDVLPTRVAEAGLRALTLDAALRHGGVEIVAVCLPPGARSPVVAAALAAGKHLLLEKPPSATAADLDAVLASCRRSRCLSAVMFQHRFALPAQVLQFDFGAAVATVTVSRPRPPRYYREGWRGDQRLAAGGVTAHLGVHYLDLACQILGDVAEVTRVSGRQAAPGIDVQSAGVVTFTNGATLALAVTSESPNRTEQLTILGRHGWMELRDGALNADLDGTGIVAPRRDPACLRAAIYQELAGAVRGERPLERAALARSRPVIAILEGLAAPASREHGR